MTRAPVSEQLSDLKATKASIAELDKQKQHALAMYRCTGDTRYRLRAWLLDERLDELRGALQLNRRAVERAAP
jgi:hypothetical protein